MTAIVLSLLLAVAVVAELANGLESDVVAQGVFWPSWKADTAI